MKQHPKHTRSGNVLFMILIAIFLLGGITALIARTSGTSEETGQVERMTISVSELLRYVGSVQASVSRMLLNGVSENEISFANSLYTVCANTPIQGPGHNPQCTRPECEIFNTRGGGLKPYSLQDSIKFGTGCNVWNYGTAAIVVTNIEETGTAANELVLEIFGLSEEACMAANRVLGIENTAGAPPDDEEAANYVFTGSYTAVSGVIGDEATHLQGKKTFCIRRPSTDTYHLYAVLIAR